jgi:hypothetical protein
VHVLDPERIAVHLRDPDQAADQREQRERHERIRHPPGRLVRVLERVPRGARLAAEHQEVEPPHVERGDPGREPRDRPERLVARHVRDVRRLEDLVLREEAAANGGKPEIAYTPQKNTRA